MTETESFKEFKNNQWKYRRRVMFTTLIFYFASVAYVLWKSESENIENYVGIITQLTLAFSVVTGAYFGASSYEKVRNNTTSDFRDFQLSKKTNSSVEGKLDENPLSRPIFDESET